MPILEEIRRTPLSFHFQPVVSIKRHAVIGYEALLRGGGGLHEPRRAFALAAEESSVHELDSLCREHALHAYARLEGRDPNHLLFLNLEADQLGGGRFSVAAFQQLAREEGLKPSQLVLEFAAPAAARAPELGPLVSTLQSFGFTVALCDIALDGDGPALIAALKPDIVKFRQDLCDKLDRDPVKQELLRCLCAMVHRQGGLCAVLGVESDAQAGMALELGADLLQGHHFSRPAPAPQAGLARVQATVDMSAARFKARLAQRSLTRRREQQRHDELIGKLVKALEGQPHSAFGGVLSGFVNGTASLECLYVLDAHGRQLTETVTWQHQQADERNSLFAPAQAGADHGLKDYYLGLQLEDGDLYTTEPYVSLATGNLCRTLAHKFKDAAGAEAIVCMDIRSL